MALSQVLVRPVEEYWIEPKETKFKHNATDDKISLRSVTQLLFRDREKVRNLQGAQLTQNISWSCKCKGN